MADFGGGGFGGDFGGAWDVPGGGDFGGGFGGGGWDVPEGYSTGLPDPGPGTGAWDAPEGNWFDRSWNYLSDSKNWEGKGGITEKLQSGLKGLGGLTAGVGGGGGASGAPPAIGGGGGLQRGNATGLMQLVQQLQQRQLAQRKATGLGIMPAMPQGGLLGGGNY